MGLNATPVPEVVVETLLSTPLITVRDIRCQGRCRHRSAEECAAATELVFPYRGAYARHLGADQTIAEPNQVLFFNAEEGYRISHPVEGGDACLSLAIDEGLMREMTPKALLRDGAPLAFRQQGSRIDEAAQVLAALVRHHLRRGRAEPLETESLALALVRRALGSPGPRSVRGGAGRRLADRVKLVLASDP
ncbi:MAG: transcriptional regulator, partial [Caulobacter sp.]|nr:transcriptional regulator [Caulobacter sp.]